MSIEIMQALEEGLEKYFGKMKIPKLWDKEEVCYFLKVSREHSGKAVIDAATAKV